MIHLDKFGIPTFSGSIDAINHIFQEDDERVIAGVALAGYSESDLYPLSGPDAIAGFMEELAGEDPLGAVQLASRLVLPARGAKGGLSPQQHAFLSNLRAAAQRVEAVRTSMEAAAAAQANTVVGINTAALAAAFGTASVVIQPGTDVATGGWVFRGLLFNDAVVQRVGIKNLKIAGLSHQTGTVTVTPAPATTGIASLAAFDTRNPQNQLLPYIGREFSKDDTWSFDVYNHTAAADVNGGAISVAGVMLIQTEPCVRPQNPVQGIGMRRAVRRSVGR